MSNRVLISYESGPRVGQEFALPTPEDAARIHPGARIVRYMDGRAYDGPQTAPPLVVEDSTGEAVNELDAHTVAELKVMAEAIGVTVPPKTKKSDIISLIEQKQAETVPAAESVD